MDKKKEAEEFSKYLKAKAEAAGKDPDTYVEELGKEGMLKAYKKFLEERVKKGAHGAKLQYIKSLKDQCADDEELVYFRRGGAVGCGCVEKEKTGGSVKSTQKLSAADKFKAKKMQEGNILKKAANIPHKVKKDAYRLRGIELVTKKELEENEARMKNAEKNASASEKDYMSGWGDHTQSPKTKKSQEPLKVKKNCGGSKFKLKKGTKIKVSC